MGRADAAVAAELEQFARQKLCGPLGLPGSARKDLLEHFYPPPDGVIVEPDTRGQRDIVTLHYERGRGGRDIIACVRWPGTL